MGQETARFERIVTKSVAVSLCAVAVAFAVLIVLVGVGAIITLFTGTPPSWMAVMDFSYCCR